METIPEPCWDGQASLDGALRNTPGLGNTSRPFSVHPLLIFFVFLPSVGASGGSVIIWKNIVLSGSMVFQNSFATSVEFISLHNKSLGFLLMFMLHVLPKERENSFNGSNTSTCLII
jgi:hypothetical protein